MNLSIELVVIVTLCIASVAYLYSIVGHAGASGYIAVMTLFSFSPDSVKPIALSLNILVSIIASYHFYKAGYFSWNHFWPFGVLSIPFAFAGGYLNLPTSVFKAIIGVILIFSAIRFLLPQQQVEEANPPGRLASLLTGAGLGFTAGLTGTGGGIFLTPLMLLMRWAKAKEAAAISAVFILVNSVSGLLGNISKVGNIPTETGYFAVAAILGGFFGSRLGSSKLNHIAIKRVLAMVLLIAGLKLLLG